MTKVRDDPRFLAKVGFGMSSPRVMIEKMGNHAVFGSMDVCSFEVCTVFFTTMLRAEIILQNLVEETLASLRRVMASAIQLVTGICSDFW